MISIVIPAHNEAQVLERTLRTLTAGIKPGEAEIIVVANGCTDSTASIAGEWGDPVRIIDTEVGNKSHALNLGDEAATGFPRFYVDADVDLPFESVRKVAAVLDADSDVHVAAPKLELEMRGRSLPVRMYYDIWTRLPYYRENMIGTGVYAVSEQSRQAFDRFPNIWGDDEFIRRTYAPKHRRTVEDATFRIYPPKTLRNAIHIRVRWALGRLELLEKHPEVMANESRDYGSPLLHLALRPWLWPGLAVYTYVWGMARLIAWWKMRFQRDSLTWPRDLTAREGSDGAKEAITESK